MLVDRKRNGGKASILQVTLTQQEILVQDSVLGVTIRDRLMTMGGLNDSKFTIVYDGVVRRVAVGLFSQDLQTLKEAVDTTLAELRDCSRPLPAGIAKMLTS